MSLSPDECKWSERLTLTQQGMRCGFTGTGVCAWCDVLEEVAMSTVWNTVEKVKRGWSMHVCITPAFSNPTSSGTLASFAHWASHRKTHWPQREEECVCGCVFVCPASTNKLENICVFSSGQCAPSELQLTKKHVWITSCPVPVTSSLTSIWPHAVLFNCH